MKVFHRDEVYPYWFPVEKYIGLPSHNIEVPDELAAEYEEKRAAFEEVSSRLGSAGGYNV